MKIGQRYFTYYKNPITNFRQAVEAVFKDDLVDHKRIKEQRVFDTLREAKDKVGLK